MAKRKKYPKLPSGWGSIRYLGKGRRNPYAVHPPCTEVDDKGNYIRPKALCYVADWYVGFAVLNSYRAGTYKPGDEILLSQSAAAGDASELESLTERILRDYGQWHGDQERAPKPPTFAEVYAEFYEYKFGENAPKKLSESRKKATRASFKTLAPLHDKAFRDLRVDDLQAVINDCGLARGTIAHVVGLLSEMYKYADSRELCDKDYSRHLVIPSGAKETEHGHHFRIEDIKKLWEDQDNPTSEMLLIMCYSGFRVSAYKTMEINLKEGYFKGGLKTAAGKDRVVPIHSAIRFLVERRLERYEGVLLPVVPDTFTDHMTKRLKELSIPRNTPHGCRHTFSALCERYRVPENDRKRLLGHAFRDDITNSVYGHRTVEELRESIEMIPAPDKL